MTIFCTELEAENKLKRLKEVKARPYQVTIFIAGDIKVAKQACQKFCDEKGECVTLDATDYIYTNGAEAGLRIGFINYARFPRTRRAIFSRAVSMARWLLVVLNQDSCTVIAPDKNRWLTTRDQDQ